MGEFSVCSVFLVMLVERLRAMLFAVFAGHTTIDRGRTVSILLLWRLGTVRLGCAWWCLGLGSIRATARLRLWVAGSLLRIISLLDTARHIVVCARRLLLATYLTRATGGSGSVGRPSRPCVACLLCFQLCPLQLRLPAALARTRAAVLVGVAHALPEGVLHFRVSRESVESIHRKKKRISSMRDSLRVRNVPLHLCHLLVELSSGLLLRCRSPGGRCRRHGKASSQGGGLAFASLSAIQQLRTGCGCHRWSRCRRCSLFGVFLGALGLRAQEIHGLELIVL